MSELTRGLFPRPRRRRSKKSDADFEDASGDPSNHNGRRKSKRPRHKKRRLTLAVLPTLLTLGNGVCGLAAIAVAMSVNLPWPDEQKLLVAGILIFAGMLFDALDGSAARMTGQASKFGAELDSLCDAITFGTAPAVLVWRISEIGDVLPNRLSWGIGVLFALCVLIRLARFNVETAEDDLHDGFEGLPSPAAAGTLAAFAIAIPELNRISTDTDYYDSVRWVAEKSLDAAPLFIPGLALLLAYLMVSRFQYPHIVQQLVRGRRAPNQIGQAMFAIGGVFVLHELALPIALCLFAFASPVRSLLNRDAAEESESGETEESESGETEESESGKTGDSESGAASEATVGESSPSPSETDPLTSGSKSTSQT